MIRGRPYTRGSRTRTPMTPTDDSGETVRPDELGGGPEGPSELSRRSWKAILVRTAKEFQRDNLTDWAAALTYYAVLALFPALIVLVSLLGLFGQYPATFDALLDIVRSVAPASAVETFEAPLREVIEDDAVGRARPRDRPGRRDLLGVRLRRRVHARLQRDLRGRGGAAVLEAPSAADRRDPAGDGPDRAGGGRAGRLRTAGRGDRRGARAERGRGARLVDRQVAAHAARGDAACSPRSTGWRRTSASRRFRWFTPGGTVAVARVDPRLGRCSGSTWPTSAPTTRPTARSAGSSASWSGCGSRNLALLFGAEMNAEVERERELEAGLPAEKSLQLPPRQDPHPPVGG